MRQWLETEGPLAQFSMGQKIGSSCPAQLPSPRKLAVPDGLMSAITLSKWYSFLYSRELCMYVLGPRKQRDLLTYYKLWHWSLVLPLNSGLHFILTEDLAQTEGTANHQIQNMLTQKGPKKQKQKLASGDATQLVYAQKRQLYNKLVLKATDLRCRAFT